MFRRTKHTKYQKLIAHSLQMTKEQGVKAKAKAEDTIFFVFELLCFVTFREGNI